MQKLLIFCVLCSIVGDTPTLVQIKSYLKGESTFNKIYVFKSELDPDTNMLKPEFYAKYNLPTNAITQRIDNG